MSRRMPVLVPLALVAASLFSACFSEHVSGPTGGTVSFAADVEPVLAGSCAFSNCHGTNANPTSKPMMLSSGQAYNSIVGISSAQVTTMARIQPGQPDNSYLIHKLQGTHTSVGGRGGQMPLGGTPLAQTTIDMIRTWVAAGALRN